MREHGDKLDMDVLNTMDTLHLNIQARTERQRGRLAGALLGRGCAQHHGRTAPRLPGPLPRHGCWVPA